MAELAAILGDIASAHPLPHLVVGDFNALTAGDDVAATAFFRRMAELRRAGLLVHRGSGLVGPRVGSHDDAALDAAWREVDIDPRLDVGIPLLPRIVGPLTGRLPVSPRIDRMLTRRLRRNTTQRMRDEGYVDCFRHLHPRARGYTCATWMPAARIDYVYATADMAERLQRCDVVGGRGWRDPAVPMASDHFPLVADFGLPGGPARSHRAAG